MTNLDLLVKKLEGQLTKEEEIDFQKWLQESDENLQFFQKMERLRKKGKEYKVYKKINIEAAWEQIIQKQKSIQTSNTLGYFASNFSRFVPYLLPIAAVIILLIGTAALFYYLTFFSEKVYKQTSFGEKISFVLPDESKVVLNANSRLWYNKNQPRIVWLEGEAFFKVCKKPLTQEKFQVITRDLKVEVLGTAFNVNSHQEQTKVYLEKGSVKLDLQNKAIHEVVMLPGEILTYSIKDGTNYLKTKAASNVESSWKVGIQLFEKTPLHKVLNKIEDLYGISIKLKDKNLTNLEMTMGIPVEDADIALETLQSMLALKLTPIDAKTYILE